MLPPQLQHGLRQRSLSISSVTATRSLNSSSLRGTAACAQARSIWGWRRPCDYASHIDPMYHRFTKYRTLRTRAKLFDKIRRRGRWDWDATQRPFFTPKHVRQAHHIGRPRWVNFEDGKKQSNEAAKEDGFELSQREKEWKDQMEAMRRRIEMDPYEAVFGKRFEPFWSPLVPSWMREEMGLDKSPRPTEAKKSNAASTSIPVKPTARRPESKAEPVKSRERSQSPQPKRDDADNDSPNGQLTTYSYTSKKAVAEPDPEFPDGQLTNYSYGSTTSWDSWTKKARREEWDSISGETRRYEYDPISNRMVQIAGKPPANPRDSKKIDALKSDPSSKTVPEKQSTEQDSAKASTQQQQQTVATTNEPRQAIPVPTETADATSKKTSVYFPSLLNTSVVSSSTKPSSLAAVREKDLDLLTAEDVRASMGKTHKRLERGIRDPASLKARAETSKLETSVDRKINQQNPIKKDGSDGYEPSLVPSLSRMQSKELPTVDELDDSAAHESTGDRINYSATNIPKQWDQQADLLQANRIRRTRGVNPEPRMIDIVQAKKAGEKNADGKPRWIDMMNARKARYDADQVEFKATQELRDAQENAKIEKLKALHDAEVNEQKLHMQAHETRYVHKIRALRQELETAYKQSSINAEMQVERIRNLEDELARAQKAAGDSTEITRYQTESEKYQRKIGELRKELDASFKQSSVSSGKHVERIRELEKELEKTQSSSNESIQVERDRYVRKTKTLRDELDRTFKQSAANAEKHVERIRELERELAESRGSDTKRTNGPDAILAEGDFSANVTKFAKDSSKWYKQPHYTPEATGKPTAEEIQKAAQKQRDNELVNEVRAIYELRYGKIDVNHRQSSQGKPKPKTQASNQSPQVVEVETDVDLGKALADYEAGQTYEYRRDNLEAELLAQEKEAHEAQALMAPESSGKVKQTIAKGLKLDQDVHGSRIVDDTIPRLIPTEIATRTEAAVETGAEPTKGELESWGIEWEEPPVYKVLAYDSGNDMFSTATTSSNFTGKETPISIPQALSQLYQPARFVPHFAELQKEGYQVVYGTKDLLVFKKVKTTSEQSSATKSEPQANLADHGVVKPSTPETTKEASSYAPGVNPIDGTTFPLEPESAGFASPTGFVGDRWETLASEGKAQSPSTLSKAEPEPETADLKSPHPSYSQPADEDADTDIRHYPRVKREERVFSGSRLQRPKKHRRHHNEPSHEEIREMKRKWHSWRARFRWALTVGLGASAVAYCVGAAAERKENKEKERWEQILEGRRGRWE
ncbi:hypothetical protein PRZ48_009461 [Zasmidium cellare]|uniref:Uncharacterized protein n=1 Tax=Zasmidium cellare TaxID=395010 RepID=A0ABR0EBS6_ZASCE|nr:hypothetical protein PRZ48_009461 [Zasmidium cellare]